MSVEGFIHITHGQKEHLISRKNALFEKVCRRSSMKDTWWHLLWRRWHSLQRWIELSLPQLGSALNRTDSIQRKFNKLAEKIQPKNAEGFRSFADFLQAFHGAMPYDILNDSGKSKTVSKVTWLGSITGEPWSHSGYERTAGVSKLSGLCGLHVNGIRITCNPITSFHALCSSESPTDKGYSKNGQTVTETKNSVQSRKGLRVPLLSWQLTSPAQLSWVQEDEVSGWKMKICEREETAMVAWSQVIVQGDVTTDTHVTHAREDSQPASMMTVSQRPNQCWSQIRAPQITKQ